MKIWILSRLTLTDWDEHRRILVRARSEEEARQLASEQGQRGAEGPEVWLDPKLTLCRLLSVKGEAKVLMVDFKSG